MVNPENHAPESPTARFRLGPWTVDPAACELSNGDEVIRLRPKVMDLLTTLARNPGEVLSKHCLLDLVWPDVTVGDASRSEKQTPGWKSTNAVGITSSASA